MLFLVKNFLQSWSSYSGSKTDSDELGSNDIVSSGHIAGISYMR